MAKLGISTGAAPDDGTGSSLLVGAARVNSNFDELYTLLGAGSTTNLAPGIVTSIVAGDNISVSGGTGQVTITGSAGTSHVNTGSLNVSGISTLGVTSITGNVVVDSGNKISLIDENEIHFVNGAGNGDVIRWGSAGPDNLRIGFGWGAYGSAAAIYSDYSMNLSSAMRTNITATGTSSGDMVYLNSTDGVDIRTNATVTGMLTATSFVGDGSGLTGVGGGSTEFVSTKSLVVTTGMSTVSNTQNWDGTYHYFGGSGYGAATTFGAVGRNGQDLIVQNDNKILLRNGSNTRLEVNNDGTIVTGVATATQLDVGDAPQNLRIRHLGSGNRIQSYQGGTIEIGGSSDDGTNYEYGFRYTLDNQVELTFNGTKKFETTNQGTLTTGIASATSFSGHGNDLVTSQWAVANSGSSHYTFTGPGNLSAAEDPTLYLARGQTYEFVVNASGHPFRIQTTSGAYDAGTQYETGVTNPGAAVGTIKFQIPFNAPNTLYYVCQNHSAMNGTLTIYPSI